MFFPEIGCDYRLKVWQWFDWFIEALHGKPEPYNDASYWRDGYAHAVAQANEVWSLIQHNYNIYRIAMD